MNDDWQAPEPENLEPQLVEELGEGLAASLNLIPVAGGTLSDVAAGLVRRRQNRRLRGFLEDLIVDLNRLEDRVDQDYMRTKDFHDLAEEILSNAADTRQQQRLDAYRSIFLNTVTRKEVGFDEAAGIATLVARWLPVHIRFLALLSEQQRFKGTDVKRNDQAFLARVNKDRYELPQTTVHKRGLKQVARRIDWDPEQVQRVWHELAASGVVDLHLDYLERRDGVVDQIEGRFYLTPFGERVIEFLDNPATP